ncbi:SMI1/KNR4 family protein [Streptomyces roseifaciens]|uniref:SMI1/KNR4 family protein n=1 Tax=Streptomyces roseifaciens TaxID=1488406 RepID=UPI0007180087|nr:SMI1/KNR4 family protein [Streptomyces roseifaciens]
MLVLVDSSVPEPWRRLPDPTPEATPAPPADLELLERTLRERLPDSIGATDEEVAATGTRLGVTLPDEVKVLYRVTRARWEDWADDYKAAHRVTQAIGCELSSLEYLHSVDGAARHSHWALPETKAVITPPDAAVQGLVGSPRWIVFGGNGGDGLPIDLTPGPRGHVGQLVLVDHEQSIGAELVADSLTDLILGRVRKERRIPRGDRLPVVAGVGNGGVPTVEAAAHPDL